MVRLSFNLVLRQGDYYVNELKKLLPIGRCVLHVTTLWLRTECWDSNTCVLGYETIVDDCSVKYLVVVVYGANTYTYLC